MEYFHSWYHFGWVEQIKFITTQVYFSNAGNKKKTISTATVSECLPTLLAFSFTDYDIVTGVGYLLT